MSREAHARFCERVGGKFPRPTRPINLIDPLGLFPGRTGPDEEGGNLEHSAFEDAHKVLEPVAEKYEQIADALQKIAKIVGLGGGQLGITRRAARREAMRQESIPTSQQPISQQSPVDKSQFPNVHAGRQQTYEVKVEGGKPILKSVQHSLSDNVPGHGPHFEAGAVKVDALGNPIKDGIGRPRLQSNKTKVEY